MRKVGYFFRSIVPFLIALALMFAVTVAMEAVYILQYVRENGGFAGSAFADALSAAASNTSLTQIVNFVYGIGALIVFIIWYQIVFVRPFRHAKKEGPRGFSFHTIMAILCLAIGLQYVTNLVVNITVSIRPDWLEAYNTLMDTAGYSDASLFLIIYSVILAPILEETLFRGLVFRYARYALPFWLANVWQALLFGVMHMNMLQGVYAFVMGLVLGFVCHRGRGIKYSIPLHILFNAAGLYFSDLFEITMSLSYSISMGIGIALTAFGLWLFYTDFTPAQPQKEDSYYD